MRGPATANAPCQQMKSKSLYLSIDHIQHGLLSGFLDSGRTCREPRFVLGFFFYTFFVLGHVCSVAEPGIPKRGCGTWGLGYRSPPAGSQGGAPVGSGAKLPEATDIVLHSQLTTSDNFNKKTYTTRQKQDKLSARN